jgi:hypothetical protein
MRYQVNKDAEPQLTLLLFATLISIGLWIASWYLPILSYAVYPLQLFATFIHEGGHVLATVLTGNSVQSLSVSPDTSGAVWSQSSGWFSQLLISSSGYLGTTAFGAGLLAWIRFGYSSRIALLISAGFVAVMTIVFGFLAPIMSLFATVTFGGLLFTVFSGLILAGVLVAIAKFGTMKWTNFAVAFLAVQSLLNAVFNLVDLFLITTTTSAHSDAANMAASTGIPGIVWVFIWMGISIFMISLGLRMYAVRKSRSSEDTVFDV